MKKILCMALGFAAAASAQAAGIGVRAGTTGVGGDVAWDIAPTLAARVGFSTLKWDRDVSTSTVSYDGRLELSNLSGLIDFSPLGPFRLTGGVVLNDNRYNVRGQVSSGGALGGSVKPGRSAVPYLGVGYGNVAGAGINFYIDLGVMFQGSPRASLAAECGGLSASACASLQNEVAAEQARLEDELKRFKYYPVLNVGITIGF